jgi:hypothetical protein
MIEVPSPQVTVSPGSGVALEFAGGPTIAYVQTGSSATVNFVAASIAQALSGTSMVNLAQAANLANPAYGLVGINPAVNLLGAGSTPIHYTLVTSGNLRPVNAGSTVCLLPPQLAPSGTGPCVSGELDIGDGIAFRNWAHDVDIKGARVESLKGVSIHVWPAGGNAFRIVDNVLGQGHGNNSVTALAGC